MGLYTEIEKSFPKIEKLFTESMLTEFSQIPLVCLEKYAGLGTMLRMYLLKPESALYKSLIQNGFTDPYKMTMEIIREFYISLHSKK